MDGRVSVAVNDQELAVFDMLGPADDSIEGRPGIKAGREPVQCRRT